MIKGAAILDVLHRCNYIALDKTGTLTEGKLVCTDIFNAEDSKEANSIVGTSKKQQALCHAVDLSKRSTHPIATAILDAGRRHLPPEDGNCRVSDFELIPGFGVRGTILPRLNAQPLLATFGSYDFVQEQLKSEELELSQTLGSVQRRYGNSISVLATRHADGHNLEWSAFCFEDQLQAVSQSAVQTLQTGSWKTSKPNPSLSKHVSIVTGREIFPF